MDFMILAPDIDNHKLKFDLYLIKSNHPILIKLHQIEVETIYIDFVSLNQLVLFSI